MSFDEIFDLTAGVYFHFLLYRMTGLVALYNSSIAVDPATVFLSFLFDAGWVELNAGLCLFPSKLDAVG